MQRGCVRDIQPATLCLRRNAYHLDLQLFILDVIRLFQDHPKFARGLKECHIIDMLEKESFACGDLEAQVKCALRELTTTGYVRFVNSGYRTIGPFAKLAMARNQRQQTVTWERLADMLKNSTGGIIPGAAANFNTSCSGSNGSFNGANSNFNGANENMNGITGNFNGNGGGVSGGACGAATGGVGVGVGVSVAGNGTLNSSVSSQSYTC